MDLITAVKGFKDILPDETGRWQYVEEQARKIFTAFGCREIRVPILERTELFTRGIGTGTDIVEKEMYTFRDRGEEYVTLRPEATASIIRAYLEHHLHAYDQVAKLYTIGPMFRRERPQKGRYRQFHQIDVEVLGYDDPRVDAEVIFMLIHFLKCAGLEEPRLEINSLGCPSCRPAYRESIRGFLAGKEEELCADCVRRLDTNPLRILDCKLEGCREIVLRAPVIADFLCGACRDHFEAVRSSLDALDVPYTLNPRMVRGLDYYTRTTFEVTTDYLGAQNAVVGGGRYDGLIRDLGGPDIPGIGFAVGFERLLTLTAATGQDRSSSGPALFIAALGTTAQQLAYRLCNHLRVRGHWTEMDYQGRGLKSQMKRADKLSCRRVLIIGDREMESRQAELRDMITGEQVRVSLADASAWEKLLSREKN
ncbi:MAG TPA: histidine--tRNA ligase [Syntrophales bacterium]|nr:histidine--tRNA ligase [Syntrophales bacterium]